MDHTYWHKQTRSQPLFESLLWSRPENRAFAGKLLIVSGNAHGFNVAAEAYGFAEKAGSGVTRVVLPDALQKTVGKVFTAGEFAPSTPSGSFAQTALGELMAMSNWADAVLIAGQLGRNSETAIMLEKYLQAYQGQLTVTKDAVDYFTQLPTLVLDRPDSCIVLSLAQLQKLASASHFPTAITFSMDMLRFVDALHEFSQQHSAALIVRHFDTIFVALSGQVSSTPASQDESVWRLKAASQAAVWWLQNPQKSFEALTTSLVAEGF